MSDSPFMFTLLESTLQSTNGTHPEKELQKWEAALSIVLIFVLVIASFLVAKVVHKVKVLNFIPESGIVMAFGLVLGLFNFLTGARLGHLLKFDTQIFDFLIIPAIIFESGYSLKKKGLFKNVISIALFAVVGTLISTLFVGFTLFLFAKFAGVKSIGT